MRKRWVVGRIYGMKYSWKGHKDRNRHKNRIKKKSGQARLVYVKNINCNIPTTWRWAQGDLWCWMTFNNSSQQFIINQFTCCTVNHRDTTHHHTSYAHILHICAVCSLWASVTVIYSHELYTLYFHTGDTKLKKSHGLALRIINSVAKD